MSNEDIYIKIKTLSNAKNEKVPLGLDYWNNKKKNNSWWQLTAGNPYTIWEKMEIKQLFMLSLFLSKHNLLYSELKVQYQLSIKSCIFISFISTIFVESKVLCFSQFIFYGFVRLFIEVAVT